MHNKHPYRYTLGNQNTPIDINTLTLPTRSSYAPYMCPVCNTEMGTRMGEKNIWHFYHLNSSDCSHESYLHYMAKVLFVNTYEECLAKRIPFYLSLYTRKTCNKYLEFFKDNVCCVPTHKEDYELTKDYEQISVEKKYGDFIPDILLSSSKHDKVIFIEMAVTHPCSTSKVDSGYKIIEFRIKSEDDLRILKRGNINTSSASIIRYNFDRTTTKSECTDDCEQEVSVFIVEKNGRCYREDMKTSEIEYKAKKKGFKYFLVDSTSHKGRDFYEDNMLIAITKGIKISNCNLCIYASGQKSGRLHCNAYNKRAIQNDALTCNMYKCIDNQDIELEDRPLVDMYVFDEKKQASQSQKIKEVARPVASLFN